MTIRYSFIKIGCLAGAFLLIIYFFWFVRSALYPFIIALFLAYMLNPMVCYLERKGFQRLWAIIMIYIILFGIVIIGGSKLLTLLIKDLEYFSQDLPRILDRIDELLTFLQSQYQNSTLPYSFRLAIDEALLALEYDVQQFIGQIVNSIIAIIRNSIGVVISPILTFYLLYDWYQIKNELLLLLPGRLRIEFISFLRDVDKVLGGIIRGQLTVACMIGIFITIGLSFLKVKFALIIGILAGIFDVIPYFGAIIGAAPAVMLAMIESPWLTVKVIVLFVVIQQIEGNIIQPKIIGENIGLHPLTVIFCVFVGGEMYGIIGMLLGVPVVAIGQVLMRHILKVLL
ncbi:AI-2E family transporter [Pelosinus sp. sgz500959]|uniref:AI-2E family transporter n=1 Tax=Pelosinus sp. sgz500959 TaxID=3242472 RepID=UPI00366EE722